MTTLRSILLHLDASPRCTARLALARSLASQHAASITALYAMTPNLFEVPFAVAEGAAGALATTRQLDTERRELARALYDRAVAAPNPPMRWAETVGEPVAHGLARHALLHDLLVLGQHDPNDPESSGVPPDLAATVLIDSGRPALVVPYAGDFAGVGREVLLAWKPTREAARALAAAIPLLRRAQRLHVVADADSDDADDEATGAAALERYLRLHGVAAKLERHAGVPGGSPGEGLLSRAADVGADLLVMGCYGHSRTRERMLGGASRTVLASMTLPVLMAH